MALYWTPQGLAALRPSEGRYDQIHYPSGIAPNGARSSASGGYGFIDPTWRTQATAAGVDVNKYPRAYMAPPEVQDAVAAQTPIDHWTGTDNQGRPFNARAQALALDPANVTGTPQIGGGPGSYSLEGDSGGYGTGGYAGDGGASFSYGTPDGKPPAYMTNPGGEYLYPGTNPPSSGAGPDYGYGPADANQPEGVGANPGTQPLGNLAAGLPQIGAYAWDKMLRAALIALGIVLVAIAAWAMVRGEFAK